ncbi:MAG TPA: FAD-binding protein [Roseiarcus sp.]|jgi:glycolate oxidase FAD binding subunit|nr:FAD-binding protein [Roseiarcus sp.]
MSGVQTPESEAEAAKMIRAACAEGVKLDIHGGDTRSGLGRPRCGRGGISTAALEGVVFYEPAEMTICARAGTTIEAVEAAISQHNQILPFEPMRPEALWTNRGEPTIGGMVATNHSGPRRVSAGAVRDAVLGLRLVNGLGEAIHCGGRVMKNVTGLDLTKLNCGAHGTLGFLTEATIKLAPKPERVQTLEIAGLDEKRAIDAMTRALGSPFGISAAAFLPVGIGADDSRALLRIEGFEDSVAYRAGRLIELLAEFGEIQPLGGADSSALWRAIRDAKFIAEPRDWAVWRVGLAPSEAHAFIARLAATALAHYLDLGGGLVWLATDESESAAAEVRRTLAHTKGHATLMRARDELRKSVAVFQPLSELELRISRGLKASFDPGGVLNFGRMYPGV